MRSAVELPIGDESYRLWPSKIVALGLKYRDHIRESVTVRSGGYDPVAPEEPVLFPKLASCLIASGEAIVPPRILAEYQFTDERTATLLRLRWNRLVHCVTWFRILV